MFWRFFTAKFCFFRFLFTVTCVVLISVFERWLCRVAPTSTWEVFAPRFVVFFACEEALLIISDEWHAGDFADRDVRLPVAVVYLADESRLPVTKGFRSLEVWRGSSPSLWCEMLIVSR